MSTPSSLAACLVIACACVLAGCAGSPEPPQQAAGKITTPTGVEMALIPAGDFVMGDDGGDADERPAHKVRISACYIDTSEVMQAAYEAMMGKNPAKFIGPDRPVDRVSWYGAIQYSNMRSLREGLKPCYDLKTLACDFSADGYRLPTEAEWEYACRAGTHTRYSFGGDASGLAAHAWFKDNSGKATHPVRQKSANAWSLFDMHGNVAEWCNDFYAAGYGAGGGASDAGNHVNDPQGPVADPRGPASGTQRVLRGGSWASTADACRSSARTGEAPGLADVCFGYEAYGFRCVRRAAN